MLPMGCRRSPDKWNKEMHFFNRWPMPAGEMFLECFPSAHRKISEHNLADHVLVDGTPDYMFNSVAAPRIKGMVPQAKFIVVLRVRDATISKAMKICAL